MPSTAKEHKEGARGFELTWEALDEVMRLCAVLHGAGDKLVECERTVALCIEVLELQSTLQFKQQHTTI